MCKDCLSGNAIETDDTTSVALNAQRGDQATPASSCSTGKF
jgi:hypothetical protein